MRQAVTFACRAALPFYDFLSMRPLFLLGRLLATGLLVTACTRDPFSPNIPVSDDQQCPLHLPVGQVLTLELPTTGASETHWTLHSLPEMLKLLEPAAFVSTNAPAAEGISRWRFQAQRAGEGHLLLSEQRPWETNNESAGLFDCRIRVE